jgi:3',5'-cyclic AMP phosphodiesterase CpdA
MAVTRVLVVSDSHMSARTPEAASNWEAVVAHIAATRPDHVVHCGDITADGSGHPEDLDLASRALAGAGAQVQALPGNHDIGDNPHAAQAAGHERLVSSQRLERYRAALGLDRWSLDVPGWRLIGINAQLLGSGLDEEDDQWHWLAAVVPQRRRIALFVHKPLVPPPTKPDDDSPGRYVTAVSRDRLLEVLATQAGSVVVSGHVHQFADHSRDGVRHVWAPTTWAVIPDRIQPVLGQKTCGVVEMAFGDDGDVDVDLRTPTGLAQQFLIDDITDPYDLMRD